MDNFLKTLFRLFEEKFPSRIKIVRNKSLDNTYITIKILYEQEKCIESIPNILNTEKLIEEFVIS